MPSSLLIQPGGQVSGSIQPPGSKSITNRALVCAAFAQGSSQLFGVLDSEDTEVMIDSLNQLGVYVTRHPDRSCLVVGCGGKLSVNRAELFVGNSGTTVRFLTGVLAATPGTFRLDGIPRMRERPIEDLLSALRKLGGDVVAETGCPPVTVRGRRLPGGHATVRGDISSQFLSGLLLAAPLADGPVSIHVEGELVSRPYIKLTLAVMEAFGVSVAEAGRRYDVAGDQNYQACPYAIEPDASAASYFWAAAAITGGSVTVKGLTRDSLQGDVGFCECLRQMGCTVRDEVDGITVTGGELHGGEFDMNGISDTVQTLATVALFAEGPTHIRGVGHIRHKETDRIGDLACELRRLGASVDELDDGLVINPAPLHGAAIETYGDHRMAMSLALAGLCVPGVSIKNPECTRKTYPDFFNDLASIRA